MRYQPNHTKPTHLPTYLPTYPTTYLHTNPPTIYLPTTQPPTYLSMHVCTAYMALHAGVCWCRLGAFNNILVISQWCLVVTGSSMITFILLANCGIKFQTLYLIPPQSHYTDTVGQSLPYPENLSDKRGATSTIFSDFGMLLPGIEPGTSES